ncbi:tetratricopeptide repeat protein [Sulfurospirillum arcachonense]|uniref:tetratricopeptide repeat protein n=1 Tax=Sulfurospirillum arcachonense TaxID=57666 RepID=UPI0004691D75|nr:tetratricopeptide repeat protein [Sulfurospirillum arcachonense]
MKTLTLASIYELQGLKSEALEIYKDLLKKDPNNKEAKIAIKRLSGLRKKYPNVNEDMKKFFVNMDSEVEFLEFERWLVKWN